MSKKVALVGHCGPDGSYLRMTVNKALDHQAIIHVADDDAELSRMIGDGVDLVLFNRELGYGFSQNEGVRVIEQLRKTHPNLKMMLVTNYPEVQAAAIAAGALPGFGKRELGTQRVVDLIRDAFKEEAAKA
jgi:two-component system chemotaxis response regulator CheY